jgi:hypothetical protein
MGPINYSLQGIQTPFQSLAGGFQMGSQMAQAQAMRQEAEARAAQQQQALLQQQAAAEQQRMLSEQLMALRNKPNPTARDYENLAMFLPKDRSEAMLNWFNTRSKEEQGNLLAFNGQVLSAAETKPEVAVNLLRERATAERNKGNEADAKGFELQANLIEQDPKMARVTLAPVISRLPGGKDVLDGVNKALETGRAERMAPLLETRASAEAQSAAVAARFAESKAVADLAMSEAKIKGLASDEQIKRQNVAIAAMNARIAAEGNDLKRQELQQRLADAQSKRDSAVREKNADLEAARGNIDNMLNTADRVLNTPMGVVGSAAGPVSARIPTVSQSTADFEALVETLGSQSFLAQIPNIKGMGQLSNAEGEKLQAALQNFSLKQSPEQLMRNVREAQRLLLKARQNIEARFGAAPSVPDTPASQTAAPRAGSATPQDVNELVRRYGGGG